MNQCDRANESPSLAFLFGPAQNFILLGEGSFLLVVLARFIGRISVEQSMAATLLLANLINHPHFARSYQLFCRSYFKKIGSGNLQLRLQNVFAGILVPIALAILFSGSI